MTARHRPLAATLLLALLLLALQVVTAQAQSALHFGDDAAYVSFGEPGELDVDRITIEAWIMLDQDDPGVILAKPGAYYLRIDDDRLLDAGFYDHANGEDWHTVTGTTPVPLGTYHHVAFTYDGAELALYLDGAPENTSLHTGGIDPFLTNPVFAGSQMFIDDYEDYANPNDDLKTYDHEVYSIGGTAGQEIDTANDRYWFYGDNTTGFEDEAISIIKGFTGQDYIVEVDQYWLQEEGLAYISQRFDHVSNKYEVTMDLRYDDAWFDKVVDDIWYTIDNAPLPPIDTHTWHTYRSKISTLPTTNHVEIWINGDFVLEADDPDLHYEKLAILVHDHTIGPVYDIFFDNLEVWIPFKGAMDELRVFDEAVSQTDLNAWMNATVDAGHPDWDHLQGYWRFDDEANPTLDYSPNNNPGFITAATFVESGVGEDVPVCALSTDSLDFGTVLVGEAAVDSFTVTNVGDGELVGTVDVTCTGYALLSGGGAYSLLADESHTVVVEFAPPDVGAYPCTVETGSVTCGDVDCTGAGDVPPVCLVAPMSLDFGTIQVGEAVEDTFTITNDSGGELVGTVEADCPAYALLAGGGAYSLFAGETHTVIVEFAPGDVGPFPCIVTTGCDDVVCTGAGGEPPVCLVAPLSLDFGVVPAGDAPVDTFTISNDGGGELVGTVEADCPAYALLEGGGAYSLLAGEIHTVIVEFAPVDAGVFPCTVTTGCDDVACAGEGVLGPPAILAIEDIGNDQGRSVRLSIARAAADAEGLTLPVLQYEAFRRIDPLPGDEPRAGAALAERVAVARAAGMLSDGLILAEGWDFAGAAPAHVEEIYNLIAPTLADSTLDHGVHWSVFFIRAATAEPIVFYDSAMDSAYSIDNLAPDAPKSFAVAYDLVAGNALSWEPSPEPDFRRFNLYRGTEPDFAPLPGTLVHAATGTEWLDTDAGAPLVFYKISAVDFAGNESEPVAAAHTTGADDPSPRRFVLHQNTPNPFNPSTLIRYEVPDGGGRVTLRIYDASGKLVRTLVDGIEASGLRSALWNGTDRHGQQVSSGVYFYRLVAPGYLESRKMILVQ